MVMQTVSGNGHANGNGGNGFYSSERRMPLVGGEPPSAQSRKGATVKKKNEKQSKPAIAVNSKPQHAVATRETTQRSITKDVDGQEIRPGMVVMETHGDTGGVVVFAAGNAVVYECDLMAGGYAMQNCECCKVIFIPADKRRFISGRNSGNCKDRNGKEFRPGQVVSNDYPAIGVVQSVHSDGALIKIIDSEANDVGDVTFSLDHQTEILFDNISELLPIDDEHSSHNAYVSSSTTTDSMGETIHIGDFVFVYSDNGADIGGEVVGIFGNEVVFRNRHASDGFDSWGADELINISLPKPETLKGNRASVES